MGRDAQKKLRESWQFAAADASFDFYAIVKPNPTARFEGGFRSDDSGTIAVQVLHLFGRRFGSVETWRTEPSTAMSRLLQMGLADTVSGAIHELEPFTLPLVFEMKECHRDISVRGMNVFFNGVSAGDDWVGVGHHGESHIVVRAPAFADFALDICDPKSVSEDCPRVGLD